MMMALLDFMNMILLMMMLLNIGPDDFLVVLFYGGRTGLGTGLISDSSDIRAGTSLNKKEHFMKNKKS